MTSSERLAVQRARAAYAPDQRVTCLEVDVETPERGTEGPVTLSGIVQTDRLRRAVVDAVERASVREVRDELAVLEDGSEPRAPDRRVLSVRGAPDDDAEQVTKLLYGAAVTAYDGRDGWRRVRTPGGYLGWVDDGALTTVAEPTGGEWTADAVVTAAPADVVDESETALETVPAGVDCRLESRAADGDEISVSFRTGARATLPASSVSERRPVGAGDHVVSVARQFLGTPYEWGGMTAAGIDCSGLAWVSYAAAGVSLPRDADQQSTMGRDVDRDALAPGDLLFFPGHVAISLGGSEYIHAYGSAEAVTINSFDPDDERYVESLDESMSATKRLLPEGQS
ncbi:NlpC/P60 family protein [Natronorubrum texcoconense]|uniref:SH3 domain-containing protein n=1 Tax=Natronorubrum texcoconense TaxID=1095776 RepID=A0A1G9D997_9EURY|nr:NlpC/P60 family protein [Natronorubrum texcoconense]SDK60334.1 SH3 domain-containing protein [Natronorubrum texcoconense]